jgi:signal transduction histidine kinase
MGTNGRQQDRLRPLFDLARAEPERAIAEVGAALAQAPEGPDAATLNALLVVPFLRMNRVAEAADRAARAVRLAARADDPIPECHARLALAQVLETLGLRELVLQELAEAPPFASEADPDLSLRIRSTAASTLRGMGRLEEATRIFDTLLAALDGATRAAQPITRLNAASTYWQVGRTDDALRILAAVEADLADRPDPYLQAWTLAIRAWIHRAVGAEEAAVADSRAARALADEDLAIRSSALRALLDPPVSDPDARREAVAAAAAALTEAEATGRLATVSELAQALAGEAAERQDLAAEADLLRRLRASDQRRGAEAEQLLATSTTARAAVLAARAESDALRARSAALAEANHRLGALMASRERLLRALAHDLRGPITALMLGLDLLDDAGHEGLLTDLRSATEQLDRLVRAALDGASLHHNGVEEPQEVRVDELLRGVIASHRLPATERGVTIHADLPLDLYAAVPPDALRRIAHNLLGNAIKFSAPDGPVELAVHARDGALTLTVADRGPGFGDGDRQHLLLDGARGRRTDGVAGHGLGLHTTYRLVVGCGGTLDLGDREGGGALVRVTLPLRT